MDEYSYPGEHYAMPGPRVPSSLENDSEQLIQVVEGSVYFKETNQLLPQLEFALEQMLYLTTFRWLSRVHNPVNSMYNTLVQCPNLTSVEILVYTHPLDWSNAYLANAPLWNLSNLTQFSFSKNKVDHDIPTYMAHISGLTKVLLASPNLIDLQIFQNHARYSILPPDTIQALFTIAMWPHLRRLSVEGVALCGSHERFFNSHPMLERLCIRDGEMDGITFKSLPNLKSLDIDWLLKQDEIDPETLQRLEHLSVYVPDECGPDEDTKFFGVLKAATSLTSLLLHRTQYLRSWLTGVVDSVPSLERLGLLWDDRGSVRDNHYEDPELLKELLGRLPKLVYLSWLIPNLWACDDGSGDEGRDEADKGGAEDDNGKEDSNPSRSDPNIGYALEELASAAPSLRFVEFIESPLYDVGGVWTSVRRALNEEGEDIYVGYDLLNEPVKGGWVEWGRCYYASGASLLNRSHSRW